MELELVEGSVMVRWVYLDEGLCGEYDSDDPDDVALLRFDVLERKNANAPWEDVDSASCCTLMEYGTAPDILMRALRHIMDEVKDAVEQGSSIKKTCEQLSWMDKSWFNERRPNEETLI